MQTVGVAPRLDLVWEQPLTSPVQFCHGVGRAFNRVVKSFAQFRSTVTYCDRGGVLSYFDIPIDIVTLAQVMW